ncbi:very short patch repair endonuclease [Candidatus Latescibacterota bacterium]
MTDHLSKKMRSWNMSRIQSKNSKPEVAVRSLLHRRGYRFRICTPNLPGKPDIVLKKYKTVIFVHGCFWHRHQGCKKCTTPSSNVEYWLKKFQRNVARDTKVKTELEGLGWNIIVVWECEVKGNLEDVKKKIKSRMEIL